MTEVTKAMIFAGYAAAKEEGLTGPRSATEGIVRKILEAAMEAARIAAAPDDEGGWRWHLDDAEGTRANLRNHQAQADMDGERVTVSRQALDEVLDAIDAALSAIPIPATGEVERETLDVIAAMMSEFVDNWPQPKKVKTALALVAKTMRAALDPPQHVYWRAGEPDCPRELKAGNGELHTLRCKVCGLEDFRANSVCRASLTDHTTKDDE